MATVTNGTKTVNISPSSLKYVLFARDIADASDKKVLEDGTEVPDVPNLEVSEVDDASLDFMDAFLKYHERLGTEPIERTKPKKDEEVHEIQGEELEMFQAFPSSSMISFFKLVSAINSPLLKRKACQFTSSQVYGKSFEEIQKWFGTNMKITDEDVAHVKQKFPTLFRL